MGDTLCAKLRCDPEVLKDLNEILNVGFVAASLDNTAYAIAQQYHLPLSSESNAENSVVMHQVRKQFYMVVNDLTTIEKKEETIAEEYPESLEFI